MLLNNNKPIIDTTPIVNYMESSIGKGIWEPPQVELPTEMYSTRMHQVYANATACDFARCENFEASKLVTNYLQQKTLVQELLYSHPNSQDPFLIEKLAKLHKVNNEQITLTAAAIGGLDNVFNLYAHDKITVGLLTPHFGYFDYYISKQKSERALLSNSNFPFKHNMEDINNFVKKNKVDLMLIANPNPATGALIADDELRYLLELNPKVKFIIDEADLLDNFVGTLSNGTDNRFINNSSASLTNSFDNLTVIRSFAKFYGLANLRIGYAVTPPSEGMQLRQSVLPCTVSTLAIDLASIALDDTEYHSKVWAVTKSNLSELERACRNTTYKVVPGSENCLATFLWSSEGTEDPFELLSRNGIKSVPGKSFLIPRGARVNKCRDPEEFKKLVDAISNC